MAASPPLAGKASTAVPARQRRVETKGVLRRMSARPKECTERKPLFAKRPWGVSAEEQAGDLRVYISEGPEYAHMGQHWTEIRTCSPENGAQAWTSTISVAFGMSGQDAQHVCLANHKKLRLSCGGKTMLPGEAAPHGSGMEEPVPTRAIQALRIKSIISIFSKANRAPQRKYTTWYGELPCGHRPDLRITTRIRVTITIAHDMSHDTRKRKAGVERHKRCICI